MKSTLPLLLAAVTVGGCSPERRVAEIQDTRVVRDRAPLLGATSAQRFGGRPAVEQSPPPAPDSGFAYALPAGWKELPLSQFRDVNLEAPGGVACWVTLMGPGAGGVLPNLNRWYDQLGLPPIGTADVAGLPRTSILGQEALRVDITSADGALRLIATALFASDRSVFLRMQGPPDAVEAQLAALDKFQASLRDAAAGAGGSGAGDTVASPTAGETATEAGGFGWTVPAGWVGVGPEPPFVTYKFQVGDASCWLSELNGDGGGLAMNIARWCQQVGRDPLSEAEMATLPTLDVLGRASTYVSLLGEGTAGGLLAVMVPLEGRTLFVRMAGASDVLRGRRAEFESFCASLTVKE